MNWLNKLERRFGRFAVPNLMMWLIGAYVVGFVLYKINPDILGLFTLSPYHILRGQVWRLVTWVLMPTSAGIFSMLIMAVLYYQLGTTLERNWGTFRFNVYIFSGMLFTVLGAFILYGIYRTLGVGAVRLQDMGYGFSTEYINMSIFLAFALTYPEMRILLMFVIPVKMKWMAVVYGVLTLLQFFESGWAGRISIFMSLLNFIIFFLTTRDFKRYTPHEVHRRQSFKRQMHMPQNTYAGGAKHKCTVCGRTELDDPTLDFRFCSKCVGNHEYCQEHLFTHQHIRID